jgi:enterochelin esterase family protein
MMYRVLVTTLFVSVSALSQTYAPAFNSHEVHPDGSITFRYYGEGAKSVAVNLDVDGRPTPMTPGTDGIWSLTTRPLTPEYYGYDLTVDGKIQLDPLNPDVRFNYQNLANQVMVPAHPSAPWELADIPHGRVDHQVFTSHVVKNLPADQSAYVIYTPPGYDQHRKGGYPVLYLLHGWSDNETGWTEIGKAQYILDSLIHDGKAVPMIVVMPLGYGDLNFVTKDGSVWKDPAQVSGNLRLYTESLLTEVMPAVASSYDIAKGRENHAIIGLSMGGLESLSIGLNHTDTFAWVGGMSSAVINPDFDAMVPGITGPESAKAAKLRLLWVACGTDDTLIKPNRAFVAWAKGKGLSPVAVETPGLHVWEVWRDNLVHFAPLLFRK